MQHKIEFDPSRPLDSVSASKLFVGQKVALGTKYAIINCDGSILGGGEVTQSHDCAVFQPPIQLMAGQHAIFHTTEVH